MYRLRVPGVNGRVSLGGVRGGRSELRIYANANDKHYVGAVQDVETVMRGDIVIEQVPSSPPVTTPTAKTTTPSWAPSMKELAEEIAIAATKDDPW